MWNLDFEDKNLKQLESSLDTENKSLLTKLHSQTSNQVSTSNKTKQMKYINDISNLGLTSCAARVNIQ